MLHIQLSPEAIFQSTCDIRNCVARGKLVIHCSPVLFVLFQKASLKNNGQVEECTRTGSARTRDSYCAFH